MTDQERQALLVEWNAAKAEIAALTPLVVKERQLRGQVAAAFFPTPTEGTNKYDLGKGYKLVLAYKLDRKIDQALLGGVREQLQQMGVSPDLLFEFKPSLKVRTYHELTAEQRQVADQALIIKPATPTLSITEPKEAA